MKARHNPFRSECVEGLAYRAEGFDWKTLELRLDQAGGRGAIIGPQGHGKTTLLLEWKERLRSQNPLWIRITEGQRFLNRKQKQSLTEGRPAFLDSAEQLGWWGWREVLRLSRRAPSLVISAHSPGRLPTLFHCRSSPRLLDELVNELSGTRLRTAELWQRHNGNIRDALRELYDHPVRLSDGCRPHLAIRRSDDCFRLCPENNF